MRKLLIALLLGAAPGPASLAGDGPSLPVELSVKEPAGVARPSWPVTSGVPLPQGAVKEPNELVLKDAAGKAVPCQMDAVCRWPDGSIKWVELNFQADLAAGAEAKLSLDKGAALAPAAAVKVSNGADAVTVDTGAIAFTVPKKGGQIVGEVTAGGKPLLRGGGLTIVGSRGAQAGVEFSTLNGQVERVEVERTGPMMARVFVALTCSSKDGASFIDVKGSKGKYTDPGADWFKVRVRLQAYAGRPFIYATVSLTHAGPMDDSADAYFKSATLRFKPAGTLTGADAEGVSGGVGGKGFVVFQSLGAGRRDYALKASRSSVPKPTFKVLDDGVEKKAGARASGSVVVSGPAGAMGFGIRRFYEYAPTAFVVRADEVALGLLPNDPEQETHKLNGGRQRSHEVLLDFLARPAEDLAAFQAPRLLAVAPPAWYADLDVFGMVAEEVADLSKYPKEQQDFIGRWYKIQHSMVEGAKPVFKVFHPGWLDYGDMPWPDGWSNGHYDWSMSMLLQFLRSGDRRFFEAADAIAWHRFDVAQNHNLEFGQVNARYAWSRGLSYYEKDDHRTIGPGPKQTHSWNRGVAYYALLTGNQLAREAALMAGEGLKGYFAGTIDDGKWRGNWRSQGPYASHSGQEQRAEGWSIENFLGCYELTGDEKYLKYAANLFRGSLLDYKRQEAWKGKGMGGGALMFGYCLSPSCRAHFYSPDREILEGIKYIVDEGVLNADYGILKVGAKGPAGDPATDILYGAKPEPHYPIFYADPMAYLYMCTGDEKYLSTARLIFRNTVRFYEGKTGITPGHGTKTGGWIGRFNHVYLYMEKQLAKGTKFPITRK